MTDVVFIFLILSMVVVCYWVLKSPNTDSITKNFHSLEELLHLHFKEFDDLKTENESIRNQLKVQMNIIKALQKEVFEGRKK